MNTNTTSIDTLAELVAEKVHDAWMEKKRREGWCYGRQRDDARKLNPYMVPYADLPYNVKADDIVTARATLSALQELGYTISAPVKNERKIGEVDKRGKQGPTPQVIEMANALDAQLSYEAKDWNGGITISGRPKRLEQFAAWVETMREKLEFPKEQIASRFSGMSLHEAEESLMKLSMRIDKSGENWKIAMRDYFVNDPVMSR